MYDKNKLLDILIKSEYKTVDNDGKIFTPSHDVYAKISETLQNSGSHITAKHIYTILKNDRNGIYTAVLKAFGINKKTTIQSNESKDSTFNITALNDTSTTESANVFNLIISEETWTQIKPAQQIHACNKRKYMSLQRGTWTHIFADKIWQQTKIPCAFSFKPAKVYLSNDTKYYVHFKAMCTECSAHLVGILYKKPKKGNDAIFECTIILDF